MQVFTEGKDGESGTGFEEPRSQSGAARRTAVGPDVSEHGEGSLPLVCWPSPKVLAKGTKCAVIFVTGSNNQ